MELLEGRELWSATPLPHVAGAAGLPAGGIAAVTVDARLAKPVASDNLSLIFDGTDENFGAIVTVGPRLTIDAISNGFSNHVIEADNAAKAMDMTLKMDAAGTFSLAKNDSGGLSFEGRIDSVDNSISVAGQTAGPEGTLQLSQEDQHLVRNARSMDDDADDAMDDEGETSEAEGSSESGVRGIQVTAF
jgi:hypothetical protein